MHEIQVLNHACNIPERRPKSMHVTYITQAVFAGLRINPYFTDICWLSWTMDGYKHFQQFFGYLWSLMVASPHTRAKLLLILPARHSLVQINRSQYVYHMHDHLRVASHVEHRQCVRAAVVPICQLLIIALMIQMIAQQPLPPQAQEEEILSEKSERRK